MFFNLFSKNKDEFIKAYAEKMSAAALDEALDGDALEELISYAREKDLSNKQLAAAQGFACDMAFEELYQDGYLDDEDYEVFAALVDACYMMKPEQKYRYEMIGKRSNAIYKIQEKGLLPKIKKDYASVKYRDGENLHFAASAKFMKLMDTNAAEVRVDRDHPFRAGSLTDVANGAWKEETPGAFFITTDRVGFRGKENSTTLELADVDYIELGKGPLRIYEKETGKVLAVRVDDYEMAGVLLSRLL